MICGRCGYDRWDGSSVHFYQGRESSGVNCFGATNRTGNQRHVESRSGMPERVTERVRQDHVRDGSGDADAGETSDGVRTARKRGRPPKTTDIRSSDSSVDARSKILETPGIMKGSDVPPVKKEIAEKKQSTWAKALDALEKKLAKRMPKNPASKNARRTTRAEKTRAKASTKRT